jgi:hypothetical protein
MMLEPEPMYFMIKYTLLFKSNSTFKIKPDSISTQGINNRSAPMASGSFYPAFPLIYCYRTALYRLRATVRYDL